MGWEQTAGRVAVVPEGQVVCAQYVPVVLAPVNVAPVRPARVMCAFDRLASVMLLNADCDGPRHGAKGGNGNGEWFEEGHRNPGVDPG